MDSRDLIQPQPSPANDSGQTAGDETELKKENQNAHVSGHDTRIERAESRTEQAEARTEQAKTRTEQAETRTEQAETRSEQAKTRSEQAEARTEQAEARTEQVETASILLTAIVESSDDAIIGKDLNGTITSWNRGAQKIFGYTAGEMVGASAILLLPDDRLEEENQILERIRRGQSVEHFETLRKARDGRLIDVSVTASPIKDATGTAIGVSKVARDISLRKRAEQALRQLNIDLEERVIERTAQLQDANNELEAFSYSVSHDLRTPLRHVLGFTDMLQKDAASSLSEKNLRLLTNISQSAKQMDHLIDDLLEFSRVGLSEIKKTEVDLDHLVKETLDDFQRETKERNIVWEIRPLPSVWADRALLRMVLVNLVSNAVKFTGTRAQPKIEIGCSLSENGEVTIFIRDNGAGFDPLYADKLFGVFQRLHSQDEFAGTGIGLANVQRIIHRHGGRTWAEGVVDGGATFYFSIPKQVGGLHAP